MPPSGGYRQFNTAGYQVQWSPGEGMLREFDVNPDVSIVLNMHREAVFLRPTLESLGACAQAARDEGIAVELVAVFDRPDQATIDTFRSTPLDGFCDVTEITVDVGSLGLARNAGIDAAKGEYIWTSDGDDLVSRNSLVELAATARRQPNRNVAVFPDYLVAFGDQFHVVRYRESSLLTVADFLFQHPYVSRIFIRREFLIRHRYHDLKISPAFAYEDWDLNLRLYGEGFEFLIARNTILFYRQRQNSLLRQANTESARLIPPSDAIAPGRYLVSLASARARIDDWNAFLETRKRHSERDFAREILSRDDLVGYVADACAIEPEINPVAIEGSSSYSPLPVTDDHWAFELASLYELTGTAAFDDIVLLPWLRPGGAEKFILNILTSLSSREPDLRVLVVAAEFTGIHEWVSLLPENFVFVDLYNAFPKLDIYSRDAMLARAILSLAHPGTRLHVKSGVAAHRIIYKYAAVFSECCFITYYRFSDGRYNWRKYSLHDNFTVHFLRQNLIHFKAVVTDCRAILEKDRQRIGESVQKYHILYTKCEIQDRCSHPERSFRLLWASRLAPEKRPELINKIVAAAREYFPSITMDVWGTVEGNSDIVVDNFIDGVNYCGAFNKFSNIDAENYDSLIYTSSYDGLPNIVLEALGAGLSVIAPDIGGIGEAVIPGQTGFLVPSFQDEVRLVNAYVEAIRARYADEAKALEMSREGRALIRVRHGDAAFSQRVAQLYLNSPAKGSC